MNFIKGFSPLHILWAVWIYDMVLQLIPVKAHISIGSQKNFRAYFRPIKEKIDAGGLIKYIKNTTYAAYKVMIIWVALTLVISYLYISEAIDTRVMVLISTVFYVCDLICVLIWCPFRLSRRRAIRTRLKPLKIGFFFVVGFDIPRIIKTFRLEKSQF